MYYITEPGFEEYNLYPNETEIPSLYNEKFYAEEKDIYESRLLYYNISINEDLSEECVDNCLLCKKSDKIFCIVCRFDYIIGLKDKGYFKICFAEERYEDSTDTIISQKNEDLLKYGLIINFTSLYSNSTSDEIYHLINGTIIPYYSLIDIKIYIILNNINSYQISDTEKEHISLLNGNGISPIDLGESEQILKDVYHIDNKSSLIILKYLTKEGNNVEITREYEVHHPKTFQKLNLSCCQNTTSIDIYVPLVLNENLNKIYNNIINKGYNPYDLNDKFYKEICTPYTSENGTDVLLDDREEFIYSSIINASLCPDGCSYSEYLLDKKYIKCECNNNNSDIVKLDLFHFSGKNVYYSFLSTLKSTNYKVMKCFKLAFDFKLLYHNYGGIISLILFVIYIIFMVYSIFKNVTPIKSSISELVNSKLEKNIDESNSKNNLDKNNNIDLNLEQAHNPPKKRKSRKSKTKVDITQKNDITKFQQKIEKESIKASEQIFKHSPKISIKNEINSNNLELDKNKKSEDITIKEINKEEESKKNKILDNYELNNLDYDEACDLDNRSYLKTYWSILLREHLILNTFFAWDDYNLFYIKFEKFIILFCTDMTMNGLFFVHESMHKKYIEGEDLTFIQKIPQLLFTVIVNKILEALLCFFSMTDTYDYEIKELPKDKIDEKIIGDILKCIKKKLIGFFVFTCLLFLFYWYFISAFCSVYQNTQIIFLKDTLISFITSAIEPFFIYAFTSFLRFISLSSYCKKQYCSGFVYKMSDIIPLF